MKLNASELRRYPQQSLKGRLNKAFTGKPKRQEIYIILDNVLDTYNIGSIFRLADAVAAKKVILCGGAETPPNHRIKKASINTTEWVKWEYFENTIDAIKNLRKQIKGIQILGIEQTDDSIQYDKFEYNLPIALIVGHESYGLSKEVLKQVDAVIELPMYGVNISLNVMVSLGIVLYRIISEIKDD